MADFLHLTIEACIPLSGEAEKDDIEDVLTTALDALRRYGSAAVVEAEWDDNDASDDIMRSGRPRHIEAPVAVKQVIDFP